MSLRNSLLDQWSQSKESQQGLSGQSSLTSSLLNTKSLLSTDGTKSKTQLSTAAFGLNKSSNTSSIFPSHGSLSLQSSNLLQKSSLSNPLLGSSLKIKEPTESTLPNKSSLASSLSRLTLKNDAPVKKITGSVEKKNVALVSSALQAASAGKSPSRKRAQKNEGPTLKKKVVESKHCEATSVIVKRHTVKPPNYSIKSDREDEFATENQSKFYVSMLEVQPKTKIGKSVTDVTALKRGFINCVSGSLIAQPNLSSKEDSTRQELLHHVENVQHYDPEFVLKVALYSRKELGIRTTSNFLLALAANFDSTRQYLKKYFCAAIALPSDWIEVAQIFQTLEDKNLKLGSLPSALRKAMIMKFTDFDEYQLAKYNKESSGKKKKAKDKKVESVVKEKTPRPRPRQTDWKKKFFDSDSSDSEDERELKREAPFRQLSSVSYDEKVTEETLKNQRFTIKQLIRKLHIKEPVQYVMSIIGKKYPSTLEEFYQKRLPGTFDETKAGKRMKLAVPETWETQVSLKGNNAKTWEDLIDHKKLPFMAMLRNLRNLIKAGISMKHHNSILRRLTDQRSVVNSKQFPFRFFSAYVALNELEENYEKNQNDIVESAVAKEQGSRSFVSRGRVERTRGARGRGTRVGSQRGGRRVGAGRGGSNKTEWWVWKKLKKESKDGIKEVPYDKNLIQRYRKALDTAVKIATTHNVQPIRGRTILLCDIGRGMNKPCSSAKGLGKPRTLKEISVLMGLMCKYACEECEFLVFDEEYCQEVQLQPGTILDNMDKVLNAELADIFEMSNGVPYSILLEKLRDRIEVDNLLIFGEDFYPSSQKGQTVNSFLRNYRHMVNPNLLYVSVTFSSPKPGFALNVDPVHPNDVYISGYSDALLRFVAERGDTAQVNHVDKIDVAFQLRAMPNASINKNAAAMSQFKPERILPLIAPTPQWRTIRVFISSTFRDMHGERDLLTRFVFPELRALAQRMFINVYEVDLRWGITEEQSKDNRALEICLKEVSCCQLFVGLLGERYGWTPDVNQFPDTPDYDWVRAHPPGASITELEMHLGALSKADQSSDTAFFFIRDNTFENDVPAAFLGDFKAESESHKSKIASLKQKILNSGLEVYDKYPCQWGGCVSGKPIVAGLEEFGARLLNCLINAVKKQCPKKDQTLTEEEHNSNLQWAFAESLSSDFIGRKDLVNEIISKILNIQSGVIGLIGKMGSGKTALLASTVLQYTKLKQVGGSYGVFLNFTGSSPGSGSLAATVRRLAQQVNSRFSLGQNLPEDFKNLILSLHNLLEEAANICPSKLVFFLDGIDLMNTANQPASLDWLPSSLPENVIFVITALEGHQTHKSLKRIKAHEITVPGLQIWDKSELVRTSLAKHRKSLNESGFGNQMKILMLKKEASNPLYLKLACEELRVFGVFEKINDKLKELPHTTAQMLQEVLARLEEEHGVDIITTAFSLLSCARDGLYPEELYDLISWSRMIAQKKTELPNIKESNLDTAYTMTPLSFTYLIRSMSYLLNPSLSWSPLMTLSNREVHAAVKLRYLKSTDNSREVNIHKILAAFFRSLADPQKDITWQSKNVRGFVELPYHLAAAGCLKELEDVICNHHFIQAKCQLGMAAKLLEDFSPQVAPGASRLQEKNFAAFHSAPRVQEYKSFVSRNFGILLSYPALEWQQAINEPSSSIPFQDAVSNLRLRDSSSYMEWCDKPEDVSECYLTLSNFKMPVVSVCVSPCSTMFATGSQDMIVRMYNMQTGKEEASFIGHSDVVTDVCFVGSSMLCSASADCTLSIWNVEQQHRLCTLKGHSRRVNSCASDLNGKLIASGSWDCTVIVWHATESGNRLCTLEVSSPVNCVDFHPSLEQVVVGSWDSLIRIYNYFHKTRVAVLRGHSTSVRDLSYSFDGRHLASASMDGDIKMWAADKGTQVGNIQGHSGPINKLTFSPNGRELITAGEDRQIKVWSGDLGVPLHCLHEEKHGAATSVSISPSGLSVAIGFHQGFVVVHDVNTGAKLFTVNMGSFAVRAITFSCDGNYILAGSDDSATQILQSRQGSKVCKLIGQTGAVLCIASSKSYVAIGGEDFTCCLYDSISQLKSYKQSKPSAVLRGHVGPVTSCCFNEDETMLATSSRDASVRLYDVRNVFMSGGGEPTRVIHDCHEDWINSCQWSNTGPYLVTASNDFNLKVFDTKTATEKLLLTGHNSAVNTVAYKYGCIVSGSSDGSLRVWSHKGTPITTLHGHTLRVNACDIFVKCRINTKGDNVTEENWADIAEKGDGVEKQQTRHKEVNVQEVIVVSAGDDGDVWIWKPLQANTLATLMGHSDRLLSVAVDKHNTLVSCSLDLSTKVWHPRLSTLPQGDESKSSLKIENGKHDGSVTFVAMSTFGFAVSGSRDGTVKLWTSEDNGSYKLVPKHTFQAHEKSVNCACFNAYTSAKIFVTGGDDNRINIWEICDRKSGFFIRKEKSITINLPIACILIPSSTSICFATWDGGIFTVDNDQRVTKIYSLPGSTQEFIDPDDSSIEKEILEAQHWVCFMDFNQQDHREIVFGATNGIVGSLHFQDAALDSKLTLVKADLLIEADHPVNVQTVNGMEVHEHKKVPKWASALDHYCDITFVGDSQGYLVAFEINDGDTHIIFKRKIHKSAVTCLVVVDNALITGSNDGTIKVWLAGVQLEQIGQFFCPSPVTCMSVKQVQQLPRDKPETILMFGDLLGNVHQLKWHA